MARHHRVVDHIVGHLAGIGVDYIFGVDGANIEDLYDAGYFRSDLTAMLAKHEFSAATMADGYSRGGAGLGMVAATSGGGSLNLVPGLGESLASRVPVLALVGPPATTMDGRGSFQDSSGRNGSLDAEALFSAVSVFCRRVTRPVDIISALPAALAAARIGGPAVLLLPKDVQHEPVGVNGFQGHNGHLSEVVRVGDPHPIVQALRRANGPVTIIAGEQVARDDARRELEEPRALLRARVACVPDAKDVSSTPGFGSSSSLGVTGVMGHPGVGSAPPYLPCTHVHTENLRASLNALSQAVSGRGPPTGLLVPDVAAQTELKPPACTGPGLRYRDAMAVLDTVLLAGVDIVVDAGNTGAAAVHYLPARRGGRFVVALGMGGMGYSFGAGIGMAVGRGRRTVVVAGDGSFFMHGMEIHTAVQYRLPVTFMLFNNNAHVMCVSREQLLYDDLYSHNRFGRSDLGAGLATMFPGSSVDLVDIDALHAALQAALAVDGPSVIGVECSADEIPPFGSFLDRQRAKSVVTLEISTHEENRFDVLAHA
ncbi:MAG TPA: thiamine pyrophosphate-dependent enzyme [Mycobacterium sp.]|nr:thiamine pyrophosphate-dependent enzyme [Mycobacterium sp.]